MRRLNDAVARADGDAIVSLMEVLTVTDRTGDAFGNIVQISVASDFRPFAGIWPSLSELDGKSAFPFQARDVLETSLATIGAARGTRPFLVRVDDPAGNPLMLVPLGIERRHGVRVLGFIDGGVADYNAPVLFPDSDAIDADAMQAIWLQICRALPAIDVAILDKIPATVAGQPNPFRFLGRENAPASGHLLTLAGTFETYAAERMPRRQDTRRKRRRLAEVGEIRLVIATRPDDIARIYAALVRQKTRRFLETRGVDGFNTPGFRGYFATMTDRFLDGGYVQLSALSVGDDIVATHWGIVAAGRFYFLLPAFEAGEWLKFSPSRLLIEDLIAWSYAQGLKIFDFGVGDEPYKEEFRDTVLPLLRADFPRTVRGHAYAHFLRARHGLINSPGGAVVRATRRWYHKMRDRAVVEAI
jgi:CelD/BcsL family acetyltransferase involved in cellulose biosynthesis